MSNIDNLAEYLSQAILLEVSASPKPGLVTRHSNGSHRDMSIITFAMSSVIVSQAFYQLFSLGKGFMGDEKELFKAVRSYGIVAEQRLLKSTKGVNTQRGILFAGGLVAAAGGYLGQKSDMVKPEEVFATVAAMTKGLVKNELEKNDKANLTAGEKLYAKYGITGIRGEVEQGFPSVKNIGLPAMEAAFSNGVSINDALVHTLISLMTVVEDSNVIWRSDYASLQRVQTRARDILVKGSIFTSKGRTAIEAFDHDCIEHRISPGGCADLLSVVTSMYLLENKEFPTDIM